MIYHVAPAAHEGSLLSLYAVHGEEAYEMYAERWPQAGELAIYHAHYIHCYDSLDEAREHAAQHGGKIYAIDSAALADDLVVIERDALEFDHPIVRDEIGAEYLQVVA